MIKSSISRSFIRAWKDVLPMWPFLALLYCINVFFALLAMGPVHHALDRAFEYNPSAADLLTAFNYTLIVEFLREYHVSLASFLDQSVFIIVLYLILQIFLAGGVVALAVQSGSQLRFEGFFRNGVACFFRFTLLAFIVLAVYALLISLLFACFSKDGLNPLYIDSETGMINRFWVLMAILLLASFLVSIFRDLAKLRMYASGWKGILKALRAASAATLSVPYIILAFVHVAIVVTVYFLYKWLIGMGIPLVWSSVMAAQFLVLFRIAYKIVRLRSFYLLDETCYPEHFEKAGKTD